MPHLSPIHPIDGVDAWCRTQYSRRLRYAFLSDDATQERTRLCVQDLRHAAVDARDALIAWARDHRARDGATAVAVVMLVYPPGLEFLPALLGAMAAPGVVAVPAYPPDPSAAPEAFGAQVIALEAIAERAGATLVLTTRAYDAARRCAVARLAWRGITGQIASRLGQSHGGRVATSNTLRWTSLHEMIRDNKRPSSAHGVNTHTLRLDATEANDSGVAFVQFTSGSTSQPKGVAVGHRQLSHNCALIRRQFGVLADDVNVSWLPQYHDMGLVGGYLVPLTIPPPTCGSGPAEVTSAFLSPAAFVKDPVVWVRAMSKYGATMTQAPDFAYRLVAERFRRAPEMLDLSALRHCLNASERVNADTALAFSDTFSDFGFDVSAMSAGYGLAESVVYVCDGGTTYVTVSARRLESDSIAEHVRGDGSDARRVASCGAPCADVNVLIVDANTRKQLRDGRVGEVWVSSRSVASGYWNETQAAVLEDSPFGATLAVRSTLLPRLPTLLLRSAAETRYLRTGDLAFMNRGELFVVGRCKDLIVIGGRNIAPEDVECTVRETDGNMNAGIGCKVRSRLLRPGSVAAFAVDKKTDDGSVCEALALVAEVRDGIDVTAADLGGLIDGIRWAVARAHDVSVSRADVALLKKGGAPRTTSGKIRRGECRRRFMAGELDPHPATGGVVRGSVPSPFPEGAAGLIVLRLTRGEEALYSKMESTLLRHCREVLACPGLSARCGLAARGAMDSFAALTLLRRIEHDVGANVPTNAVLREGASVRSIVHAVLPLIARGGSDGTQGSDGTRGLNETHGMSTAHVAELPASMRPDTCSGLTLAVIAAVVAFVVKAISTTPAPSSGHPSFAPGWLGDGWSMDRAHSRLIEWPRSVLPAQLTVAGVCWIVRYSVGEKVRAETLDFIFALCNAALVHGVVGALHVMTSIVLYHLASKVVATYGGSNQARRVCAWTSCVCILLACDWLEQKSVSSVHVARGWYGAGSFTHWKAMRLTALRVASHGLAAADVSERSDLKNLVGYALYPPLYQCGPLLSYESFRLWRNSRHRGGGGKSVSTLKTRAVRFACAIGQVVAWSILAEVVMQVGYRPSLVFAAEDASGADNSNAVAHVLVFLTVTWATSHAVFGAPWAIACFVDGIAHTPHDTPLFWTESSRSFRRHWSSFHASLHSFYLTSVFAPLGAGHLGTLATVALSVLMHGTRPHWIAWGIVNFIGLTAERVWSDRGVRLGRVPGAFAGALNQTVAVCSALVSIAMSAELNILVVAFVVFSGSLGREVLGDGVEAGAMVARVEGYFGL